MLAAAAGASLAFGHGPAQASPFGELAGPGEKLTISAAKHEDGTPGHIRNLIGPDGGVGAFTAEGFPVHLHSPRIDLKALKLDYDGETGIIDAAGDVELAREGVYARSGEMLYNAETGEITFLDSPEVEQLEEGQYTRFWGMDRLYLTQNEDGSTEIRLVGGEEIHCDFLPASQAPERLLASAGSRNPGEEGGNGGGQLGALGDELRITTRAGSGGEEPTVLINTTAEGELKLFRAEGAVSLDGDDLRLRSDVLEFDGQRERLEALHDVYVMRDNIEADCGRLQYDLPTETITLTINPIVRLDQDTQYLVISNLDMYRIIRNPDGTTTTDAVGDQPTYEIEEKTPPPDEPEDTSPVEIQIDSEEDIERIR